MWLCLPFIQSESSQSEASVRREESPMDVDQPSPSAQDTQSIGQYYFLFPVQRKRELVFMECLLDPLLSTYISSVFSSLFQWTLVFVNVNRRLPTKITVPTSPFSEICSVHTIVPIVKKLWCGNVRCGDTAYVWVVATPFTASGTWSKPLLASVSMFKIGVFVVRIEQVNTCAYI